MSVHDHEHPVKPAPKVVLSARTTQELVVDKAELARQLQRSLESALPAPMLDRQQLEPGCALYDFDYQRMADFMDLSHEERRVDPQFDTNPLMKSIQNLFIEGQGKDTTLVLKVDMKRLMDRPQFVVDGIDSDQAPLNEAGAIEALRSCIKIEKGQMRLDGQKLLSGLQGMSPDTTKMDYGQRREMMHQARGFAQHFLGMHGAETFFADDMLTIRLPFDKMFGKLETVTNSANIGSIVQVRRFDDGHAHIKLDYRQMVDLACAKADELLKQKYPNGENRIEPLGDETVRITLTNGGFENAINKLVDRMAVSIAQTTRNEHASHTNMGTLADKPSTPLLG